MGFGTWEIPNALQIFFIQTKAHQKALRGPSHSSEGTQRHLELVSLRLRCWIQERVYAAAGEVSKLLSPCPCSSAEEAGVWNPHAQALQLHWAHCRGRCFHRHASHTGLGRLLCPFRCFSVQFRDFPGFPVRPPGLLVPFCAAQGPPSVFWCIPEDSKCLTLQPRGCPIKFLFTF